MRAAASPYSWRSKMGRQPEPKVWSNCPLERESTFARIVFPEVFEFHRFGVTIGQTHVDRARHFFAGCDVAWSAGSASAAMSRDGASSHVIYGHVQWLARVKVGVEGRSVSSGHTSTNSCRRKRESAPASEWPTRW